MDPVKMKFMIPVSPRIVKNLLAAHQPVNTSLRLANTPVIVIQDVPEDSLNLIQVPSDNVIVRNVNSNIPSKNVKRSSTSLRSFRIENASNAPASSEESCDTQDSTDDVEIIEESSSTKYVQPSATKILSCGKTASIKTIIESLPEEPEVILVEDTDEPVRIKREKLSKKLKEEPKEVNYKCDICDIEFKKRYLYQRHMHEHSQEKPHHCPKCSATFNVPTNFTLHMATHNIGEPKCPMCNKKFARIASLKTHMLIHEKDENLYCPECDGVFETKSQLEAHMKLHDTDNWPSEDFRKCKLCRAKFTHPALYRQHLRDHYKVQTKINRLTKCGNIKQRIINSCRICKKSFDKPSQLARHLRVHTGEKPYKCNLCNRGFTQKGSLKIHMVQHGGNRPHSCTYCHAKFSQKGNLNSHILRTHKVQKGSPVYRCSHCPCVFKTLGSLNGHLNRTHTDDIVKKEKKEIEEVETSAEENDDEISAKQTGEDDIVCDNEKEKEKDDEGIEVDKDLEEGFVVTDDNEKTAMVTVLDRASSRIENKYIKIKQRTVNNSRFYECSHCDKKFKKPSDLMRHLRIHTLEKPFKCNVCNRGFTLKSTLLGHERTHATEERFRCRICKAPWKSQKELLDHQKLHAGSYTCEICQKECSSFIALKLHTATDHAVKPKKKFSEEVQSLVGKVQLKDPLELKLASNGLLLAEPKHRNDLINGRGRPHKCPSCPAAFMKLSHLKQHHRKHTGDKPFECNLCNKKFTTISALKAHGRIHDFDKPFKCPLCSMNFTTKSSMKRHLVTHTNKRPYMCPYCNKTFKTTVNCRKHIKVHKLELAEAEVKRQKLEEDLNSNPDVITLNDGEITLERILIQTEQNQPVQAVVQEKDQSYVTILPASQNVLTINQNLPIVNDPNIATAQKHLANETGTVTLANYSSGQTFTPENMKALEASLNQQLLNIDMNLGVNDTNKDIQNQASLELQNQPILSIIYGDGKTYESQINTSATANNFVAQLDNFDINQMNLQTLKNEIEMRMNAATPMNTNMINILPNTAQENPNVQPDKIQLDFTNFQFNQVPASNNQTASIAVTNKNHSQGKQILISDSNLQCHMCKKREFSAETLKEHLKTHQGIREFECTYCLSKFCSSGGLSRHMKIHETPETHKCYDCNQEFPTSRELTVHLKEHVRQELEMKNAIGPNEKIDVGLKEAKVDKKHNECTYCSKVFRKPSDLIRHIRTHTGERPYKCPHCEKSFAVKCTLDSHVKVHDGIKEFHCYVCSNVFATKGSLKVHMRLHTGDKPFKCEICEMRFRTSGHRKVHMMTHTRRNSVNLGKSPSLPTSSPSSTTDMSSDCSSEQIMMNAELMATQQQINNQIIANHQNQFGHMTIDQTLNTITLNSVNDQITFNADGAILNDSGGLLSLNDNNQLVANLQYFLSNGLVSVQVDNPPINAQLPVSAVDISPADFEDINTNNVQKQTSDSQIVYTPETINTDPNLTTINQFDLQNCMVLHVDNAGNVSYEVKEKEPKPKQTKVSNARRECDVCGKIFAKPCQVERHKRVHTGERPFKCEICLKCFAQKSTLQMHRKHHTGVRPYPCPRCERSFTQSGNLQTHLKRIHKLDSAEIKLLMKPQNTICETKLSVDDIFVDFSFADLLR